MIRRAIDEDAALLEAVIRAAYAPFRKAGVSVPPVEDDVAGALAQSEAWVAEIEGQIAGGIFVSISGGQGHVMNLAVDPAMARRGIGRALLSAVEGWAMGEGLTELRLVTHSDMGSTQAFYRRLGWYDIGQDGTRLYMSKRLIHETGAQ